MRSNGELISVSQSHYCCKGGGRGGGRGGGNPPNDPSPDGMEMYAGTLRPAGMTSAEKKARNSRIVKSERERLARDKVRNEQLRKETEEYSRQYNERVSKVTDRQLDILEKVYDGGNSYSPAVSRIIFQVQPQRREQDRRDRNPIQRQMDIGSILSARGRMP